MKTTPKKKRYRFDKRWTPWVPNRQKKNATDLKKDEHPNICFSIYELKSTKNSIFIDFWKMIVINWYLFKFWPKTIHFKGGIHPPHTIFCWYFGQKQYILSPPQKKLLFWPKKQTNIETQTLHEIEIAFQLKSWVFFTKLFWWFPLIFFSKTNYLEFEKKIDFFGARLFNYWDFPRPSAEGSISQNINH